MNYELKSNSKKKRKTKLKHKHKQQYLYYDYYEKKIKLKVQTCLTSSEAQLDKFRSEFIARIECPPSTGHYPVNISGLVSLCKTCKTALITEWNA